MPELKEKFYCEKCKRMLGADQFYVSNNLTKYPERGRMHVCKKCMTMHLDNWDPSTYLPLLEEADVPYVPEEWNSLMMTYAKDPSRVTGTTILGRYLAKMKLNQYRNYRWRDNDFLRSMREKQVRETMERQGYSESDIQETLAKGTSSPVPPPPPPESTPAQFAPEKAEADFDLTEDDKRYLRLKWGSGYRAEEWVQLEQLYNNMLASYDIQTAGDLNTLKLVCKSSLKANQLLDLGDIESAQKAAKMYDIQMKSGKWTAAQNKNPNGEDIDSVGQLVAMCERQGFIPRYYTDGPQDHADRVIEDLKRYTHDLIEDEHGLGMMIENALKQIAEEQERIQQAANASEDEEENQLFDYDNIPSFSEASLLAEEEDEELAAANSSEDDEDGTE